MLLTLLSFLAARALHQVQAFDFDIKVGGQKDARFDLFDGTCGGRKDMLIILNHDSFKVVEDKLVINATFTVKQDLIYPPQLNLDMKRCKSKENLNSCETYHSFKTDRYCQLVTSRSDLWNPFFSKMEPKWTCPMRKGVYKMTNGVLDIAAFLLFPADGWFWKVRGDLLDGRSKKLIMCVLVEAKVDYRKKSQQ